MIATTNLPGSSHFAHFRGTKAECTEWLTKRENRCKDIHGGLWYNVYSPADIIAEREAKKWRYRDGTKVFGYWRAS